jgi:hypothetical protein
MGKRRKPRRSAASRERELRHRTIAAFLQAEGPVTLPELAAAIELPKGTFREDLDGVVSSLVDDRLVAAGALTSSAPPAQYVWAARWKAATRRREKKSRKKLSRLVVPKDAEQGGRPAIDSEPVAAFHKYIIKDYTPPEDKQFLVFFQCSVRRPFSTSPSQAFMRKAVSVATGWDPKKDFDECPVHVVVLASTMGPVPYEFEDLYPANIGGGGVKHFRPSRYAKVRPILAKRMAQYLTTHGRKYKKIASFTQDRYGEVMRDAAKLAHRRFPIFPDPDGPSIITIGGSKPRTYWQKRWIQLYLEIVKWLDPSARRRARARLKELDVVYR